jgi:integrase
MSLAEARQAKDKNKTLMRQGIDPQQHKKDQINEGATFKKMFFEWHDFKKDDWSNDYADDVIQRAKMYLLPYIGNKPMSTIDSKTMRILLKQIERKGIIDTLQKIRSIASRVFKYSVGLDIIKSDPTRDLSTDIFKRKKTVHYATITNPAEIGGLLRAIENYKWSYAVGTALKIAPHVFLRPSELAGLTWDEVDFTNRLIRIDASRMKMRRAHIVPMSNQVLSTLNDLHLIDVSSKFLFPSPRSASRHISPESIRAGLRRLGFTNDDITTHGFRHMASTQLNELGFNGDVIERQLAHCESNKVRAAYNHAELLPDRVIMMQCWSDQLDKLRKSTQLKK